MHYNRVGACPGGRPACARPLLALLLRWGYCTMFPALYKEGIGCDYALRWGGHKRIVGAWFITPCSRPVTPPRAILTRPERCFTRLMRCPGKGDSSRPVPDPSHPREPSWPGRSDISRDWWDVQV